jgi:hypothetical protein
MAMMKLTKARVEQIRVTIKRIPAAPPTDADVTKQEAVKMLAGELASLQRRGYTLEQIAESLKGEGLELTTPTLKSYLARAKAGRKRYRPASAVTPSPTLPMPAAPRAATAAPTKKESPAKGGKDAFLAKDKDSY